MSSRFISCFWVTLYIRLGCFLGGGDAQNAKEGKLVKFRALFADKVTQVRRQKAFLKFLAHGFLSCSLLVMGEGYCTSLCAGMTAPFAFTHTELLLYCRRQKPSLDEITRLTHRTAAGARGVNRTL